MKHSSSTSTSSTSTSFMKYSIDVEPAGAERREHRRHDLEMHSITVERFDGTQRAGKPLGQIVDISAGGVRLRTLKSNGIKPDQQIRVRLELPTYAGISPFLASSEEGLKPRHEWVGWMTISRVISSDEESTDLAGRLVDMDEIDRGMLGLYLSTQPLAA